MWGQLSCAHSSRGCRNIGEIQRRAAGMLQGSVGHDMMLRGRLGRTNQSFMVQWTQHAGAKPRTFYSLADLEPSRGTTGESQRLLDFVAGGETLWEDEHQESRTLHRETGTTRDVSPLLSHQIDQLGQAVSPLPPTREMGLTGTFPPERSEPAGTSPPFPPTRETRTGQDVSPTSLPPKRPEQAGTSPSFPLETKGPAMELGPQPMSGRMDTPVTGDLVRRRPSSGVTASSGQWEDNGLRREDPGDLTSRFQPEGNNGRLRESRPRRPCLSGQKTKDRGRAWGQVISDAQVESAGSRD
ncbi:uncharacterized protein LOC120369108 isoform X2 [Mauremys reevesii]|uniref:uncharacterized protein LOC120369108 isoform X2 n=2 Tax=Mauremys reevesii TaxID=260615 RepID=UPI0019400F0D|nr:uncharacterized protein LOC120369108 isoform X2 [Mauremys reevesii]